MDEPRPDSESPHVDQTRTTSPTDASRDPTPLLHRLGDFEILREIGRGGMGVVYEARQVSLNRPVALKVLPPGLGLTPQAVQRFHREAQAAAKLHHTHIVPVYAVGEEQGCHYYAMELIDGQPLAEVLRGLSGEGKNALFEATVSKMTPAGDGPAADRSAGAPPATPPRSSESQGSTSLSDTASGSRRWFDTAASLTAEVAEALHYAHGHGIVHRDIKPANLMLSKDGKLCVTDFGLAQVAQEPGMTVSGSLMGTPAYMSPEQVAAGRVKIDHRTDVYSLGTVLYEMLTLRRPFGGESREEVLSGILTKEPRSPRRVNPRVPVDLETICLKAIEKDPDRRYATAGLLAEDLRQYLQRGLIAARRAGPLTRTAKWVRRHPVASVTTAAVLLVVALAGVALQQRLGRGEANALRLVASAELALKEGRYREGLARVDQALAIEPTLLEARKTRGRLLLYQLWPIRELATLARSILAENPDDWEAHAWLSSAGVFGLEDIDEQEQAAAVERLAPDTATAWFYKGMVQNSETESVRCYDRALEIDPGHYPSLLFRSQAHQSLKNFPAAIDDAERAIAVQAHSPRGRTLLALSYAWGQHDAERALAEFEKAIALDPDDPVTYTFRSGVYNALLGQPEKALADLTKALELAPGYFQARSIRSEVLLQLGRQEEALAEAQRTVRDEPDFLACDTALISALAALQRPEALKGALEALEARAGTWLDRPIAGDAHGILSGAHLQAGELEDAVSHASRNVEMNPDSQQAYVRRALARRQTEGERAVVEECDRIAALPLKDPEPLAERGSRLYEFCRRPEAALADFAKAIEAAPAWADVYSERGRILMLEGRHAEALADHDKAIELAPRWTGAYFNRARSHGALEQWPEALADLEHFFALGAEDADARQLQAMALLHLGRDDEAIAAAEQTVRALPLQPRGYNQRAFVYFWLGRVDEAIASLDKAIEVAPSNWVQHLNRAGISCYKPAPCRDIVADLETVETIDSQSQLPGRWRGVAWALAADLWGTCPSDVSLPKALDLARRAATAAPNQAGYQITLGLNLYRSGRYEEARAALLKGVSLAPPESDTMVPALCTLAMTEWKLGKTADARATYARALDRLKRGFPRSPLNIRFQKEAAGVLGIGG